MSNAFASALEISAKIIRHNLSDPATARRLIAERLQSADQEAQRQGVENGYVDNLCGGCKAVLVCLYAIAKRDEK